MGSEKMLTTYGFGEASLKFGWTRQVILGGEAMEVPVCISAAEGSDQDE